MTLTDHDHDVARIIKDLEERIADLEENGRGQITPNRLVKQTDTVTVGDTVMAVTEWTIAEATWNETGWRTSAWGQYD